MFDLISNMQMPMPMPMPGRRRWSLQEESEGFERRGDEMRGEERIEEESEGES